MKMNNEQATIEKVIKAVENFGAKVVTIAQNPNNIKQARIYVDDCLMINWFDIEANFREQIKLADALSDIIKFVIVMESSEWENYSYWTTTRIELAFLEWDTDADAWWDSETRRGKNITERYNNLWE